MALNIRKAIQIRGLEVREVASRMGITPVAMSKHINGNPSVEVLERIAKVIPCRVIDLFDEEEQVVEQNIIVCPKCGTRLKVTKE